MTTKLVPISKFKILGNSMIPTLKPGDQVLTFNWFINFNVGDLIVLKQNSKEMIKRIQKSSDREVFVVGDNENDSIDSKDFGWVKKSAIIGKVILRLDSGL